MPVTEDLWSCCECDNGSYNWGYENSCATCGHTRCKKCRVENGGQQTLYISLQKAVEENNMDIVLQLLNNGANVNMRQNRMLGMRDFDLDENVLYDVPNILFKNGLMLM